MGKDVVGANYKAPAAKSTLGGSSQGGALSKGVEDGLSSRSALNVNDAAPKVSSDGSHAGFATERLMPRTNESASHHGKSFQIEQ